MGKIIQLDNALSNKIAAGEVVERPASVVKELVENSLDAGSTVIEIDVEEAGLTKIRIIDNGEGIVEEDVSKAFHRHATSKIKDETDLFRIRTLGFRGEALPSIASVSRLEMNTSTGDSAGTRIVVEGGKETAFEKTSSRRGTDITVTDLFFNTPARLKYVRTIHTELGNITDLVNRLALSHPEVSFRLTHNGKRLLHTNGNGDVRQVLAAIYGMAIAKMLVPLEGKSLDYRISGFASLPEVTRASRNYISTMINGRFIRNFGLAKAVMEGYHTLLPIGRYPIALLNIEMDPILVDVNVHPSKMEVRISKEAELYELVKNTISTSFKDRLLIPSGVKVEKAEKPKSEQTFFELEGARTVKPVSPADGKFVRKENFKSYGQEGNLRHESPSSNVFQRPVDKDEDASHGSGGVGSLAGKSETPWSGLPSQVKEILLPTGRTATSQDLPVDSSCDVSVQSTNEAREVQLERVPRMYPIGQMHGTYILAQNENGLYIIDQHAAQERIKYEFFREKVGQVANELQDLLVPLTFEYSTDECVKIMEYKDELEKVGVFLEDFGPNSFIIRSHPQWLPQGEEKEVIEGMIEQLLSMKKVDLKKLREEAAIMMSCKGSIKANHYLRNDEIQALLDELRLASDPFTCPHGRPVIVHFSSYEMEKMFKRVM
ncbi:DNA mismatch repair endonuclease MutL [Neobacillus notoginsengisoli]|uniref:DNA mismatch repair protein MutL n=1 Tax=Neobacillus notoginsengisoli TaxID=1578198 RepID=A0A417YQI7_9BACI|nr:DNA mismatch repair endonuclease MutL [Neobacillus notoginsengisoli]RHW36354.1 DNA mismatch repair endonuclease MutL [Neobacillus notoginsengisoli]